MNPEVEHNNKTPDQFDEWALIELFGHNQIVGRVTEKSIGGGAFVRVDVPAIGGPGGSPGYTRFFSPSAIYSISPVEENVARALLTQSRFRNEPVERYCIPQIAATVEENKQRKFGFDPEEGQNV